MSPYDPKNPPMATLLGHSSPFIGKHISAAGGFLTIGRGKECQMEVDQEKISRKHARLTFVGDHWEVEDLESANGTFVNGSRVSGSAVLHDGDLLGLGPFEFTFRSGQGYQSRGEDTLIDDSFLRKQRLDEYRAKMVGETEGEPAAGENTGPEEAPVGEGADAGEVSSIKDTRGRGCLPFALLGLFSLLFILFVA